MTIARLEAGTRAPGEGLRSVPVYLIERSRETQQMLSRRTVGWACSLAGLMAVVPLCSSVIRSCGPMEQPLPLQSIEEVASRARIQFPLGCRLIEGEWFGRLNTYGYAKVAIPSERLTEFLNQPSFAGKYQRSAVPLENNPVEDNPQNEALLRRWKLSTVKRSISASVGELNRTDERMPVALFIDLDDPGNPLAYLHWFN